jgi:hypothetical protein
MSLEQLTNVSTLSLSKITRDSHSHIPTKSTRNISRRVEPFCSNHCVSECVNVGWWIIEKPSLRLSWQAESQVNAQLVEQELNLFCFWLSIHTRNSQE